MANKPPLTIRVVFETCLPAQISDSPPPRGHRGSMDVMLPKPLAKFLKSLRLLPTDASMKTAQTAVDDDGYRWIVMAENEFGRVSYVLPEYPVDPEVTH